MELVDRFWRLAKGLGDKAKDLFVLRDPSEYLDQAVEALDAASGAASKAFFPRVGLAPPRLVKSLRQDLDRLEEILKAA